MTLKLSVVIPTFNEFDNLDEIVKRLDLTLSQVNWEVIFVDDDSPDGTATKAKSISLMDSRVRCIKRVGRRGLSSACVEGILSSSAPYVAVMDADLQHDEGILPVMLHELEHESYDLVVGTRYMEGGGVGDWDESRKSSSKIATVISQKILGVTLNDPMSGFFMMKRDSFDLCVYRLSNMGFKILLDIFVSSPKKLTFKEIPFQFRQRYAGESKLDQKVIWDYFLLLVDKTIGQYIPTKLISFACIGAMGVGIQLLVLGFVLKILEQPFTWAQATAVVLAMVFNFNLNNILTYRDQKLVGFKFWTGLLKFMLACSVGALANVGVASLIYKDYGYWIASGVAGVLVGVVWNYVATSLIVWPKKINK
jgi:dolichol-phosphate mannosyltransferase